MMINDVLHTVFCVLAQNCFTNTNFPDIECIRLIDDRKNKYILEGRLIVQKDDTYIISIPSSICEISFDRTVQEILHQMVHLYIYLYYPEDYRDNSNRRFHLYFFRKIGLKVGLKLSEKNMPNIGYEVLGIESFVQRLIITHLLDVEQDFYDGLDEQIKLFDLEAQKNEKLKQKRKMIFYTCPNCKTKVMAFPNTKVVCGECGIFMKVLENKF